MSSIYSINSKPNFQDLFNSLSIPLPLFKRACFLMDRFNANNVEDLPIITGQLTDLKETLINLSTNPFLLQQEKVMINAIGMAIDTLLKKNEEIQKTLLSTTDLALSNGLTAETLQDYVDVMRMTLQTTKKQCFFTLELVRALFSCKITNPSDLNFLDEFFINLHTKTEQNWYYNIFYTLSVLDNIINDSHASSEGITNCFCFMQSVLTDKYSHLSSVLDFFNIVYDTNFTNAFLGSDFAELEQAYVAFLEQIVPFSKAYDEALYMAGLKLVTAGNHFNSKLKVPEII